MAKITTTTSYLIPTSDLINGAVKFTAAALGSSTLISVSYDAALQKTTLTFSASYSAKGTKVTTKLEISNSELTQLYTAFSSQTLNPLAITNIRFDPDESGFVEIII